MKGVFTNAKNLFLSDFETKNNDFTAILAKCGILALTIFLSCFLPFFVYIAFVLAVLFAITQLNGRAIYYLVFLMPLMGVFKKNGQSTYMLAYLLCIVLLMLAIRLVIEVFVKKTKKINWWFSIFFAITLIYFMVPFTFPDFSISFSLILGLCLVFCAYYYKEDLNAKELGLLFVLGVCSSIFIGLFYPVSSRLQSMIEIFYAYGLKRFSGAYTNPNILAGEMMFALGIVYTLMINKQIKTIQYPLILIFTISLIYSMSKSGLIIFATETFIFVVLYLIKNHKWQDFVKVASVLILVGGALLIFNERLRVSFGRITAAITPGVEEGGGVIESPTINMEELTTGRSTIWAGYIDAIFDSVKSALFGYGVGAPYLGEYAGITDWCPHNTYLQCLYFVGFFGVLLMFAMLVSSNGIKKVKDVNWFNVLPIIACAMYLFAAEFFSFRLAIYLIVALFLLVDKFKLVEKSNYKLSIKEFVLGSEIVSFIESKQDVDNASNDTKIKVLHLLASNRYSGAENVACQIINAVGDEMEFAYSSPNGEIANSLKEKNITYYPLSQFNAKELRRVIEEFNPTIIHAHDLKAIALATLAGGKIPIIAHIHQNHPKAKKLSLRSLVMNYCLTRKKIKQIIWVSNSCFDDYKFKNNVVKKSEIITNIIDCKLLEEKASNAELQDGADVVYLGRLTYPKNPQRLINIAKLLVNDNPSIKIAIIGSGDLMEECKGLAVQNGVDKNIKFYGFLSNGYGILKNSRVFLLTSRSEGCPMCVLEAQAFGLPIVCPDIGGLKRLIINDRTGLIYNTDEEAKVCIERLLTDFDYYSKIQANVVDFSISYNNIDEYKLKMQSIYKENK